jgi:ribosomal protein S6
MAKTKEAEAEVLQVYELGSHIVSSIPEEQVAKEYQDLKDLITTAGGTVVSEEAPKLMDLAYTMVKHVHGKNERHATAHFSWVKFEIDPKEIPEIHDVVSKNSNILRFIIVKTVKESTLYGHKFAHEVKEGREGREGKREYRKEKVEAPEVKPQPEAEIVDQAIENIVNE